MCLGALLFPAHPNAYLGSESCAGSRPLEIIIESWMLFIKKKKKKK
jgi:hypothetical protein